MVQWLRLCTFTAGSLSLIRGWGTKIPQAVKCSQKKKKDLFFTSSSICFIVYPSPTKKPTYNYTKTSFINKSILTLRYFYFLW